LAAPRLSSGEAFSPDRTPVPPEAAPVPASADPALEAAQVLRAQKGDQEAFRILVEAHSGRIFGLFRRLLGHRRDLAEDMTQEVFLRAWRGLPTFVPGSRFSTWLHRIALNYWIQEHRRRTAAKRSGRTLSLDAPLLGKDSDLRIEPPSREIAPDRAAGCRELAEALPGALESLEPEMRMAVVLRDLEGHSYEEVASLLGVPLGTVRSRLHRARCRLQDLLKEFL